MREITFEFIWKHEKSIAKGVYTIRQVQQGCATPPKSKSGGILRCWELVATRQFTGINDSQLTDIYEGDKMSLNGEYVGDIIYDDGAFQLFIPESRQGRNVILQDRMKRFVICGNIYEQGVSNAI